MYIKRQVLDEIGLFDLRFDPCYFEDSDLCYRAWSHNWKVVVAPEVAITHHGGATAGVSTGEGYKRYQKENASKFLEIHQSNLAQVKKQCTIINQSLTLI